MNTLLAATALRTIAEGFAKLAEAIETPDVASTKAPTEEKTTRTRTRTEPKPEPEADTKSETTEDEGDAGAEAFEPDAPAEEETGSHIFGDPTDDLPDEELTLKVVQSYASRMIKESKREEFKKLLKDNKAASLSEVPEKNWGSFVAAIKKELGE